MDRYTLIYPKQPVLDRGRSREKFMPLSSHLKPFLLTSLMLPSAVAAQTPAFKVVVSGMEPSTGTVELSLFDSEESFMKEPILQHKGSPDENGEFTWNLVVMPPGSYALVAVHDANGNGQLDRGFLGLGGESYGFSNNVSPWFGWPDFSDAAIIFESEDVEVRIHLD